MKTKDKVLRVINVGIFGVLAVLAAKETIDEINYIDPKVDQAITNPIEVEEVELKEITYNEYLFLTTPIKNGTSVMRNLNKLPKEYYYVDSNNSSNNIGNIILDYKKVKPEEDFLININDKPAISQDIWYALRGNHQFTKEIVDLNQIIIQEPVQEKGKEVVDEYDMDEIKETIENSLNTEVVMYSMNHKEFGVVKIIPNINRFLVGDMLIDLETPFFEDEGKLYFPIENLNKVFSLEKKESEDGSVIFSEKRIEETDGKKEEKEFKEANRLGKDIYELLEFEELEDLNQSLRANLKSLGGENLSPYKISEITLNKHLVDGREAYQDWHRENSQVKVIERGEKEFEIEKEGEVEDIPYTEYDVEGLLRLAKKGTSLEIIPRVLIDNNENYYILKDNKLYAKKDKHNKEELTITELILISKDLEYTVKIPINHHDIKFMEEVEDE